MQPSAWRLATAAPTAWQRSWQSTGRSLCTWGVYAEGLLYPAISPWDERNLLYFGREGGMISFYEMLEKNQTQTKKKTQEYFTKWFEM